VGPLNITNARYAEDPAPLDDTLACPASRDYAKAYLHHLLKAGEILGQVLLSWHNLAYYQSLMQRLRDGIAAGRLDQIRAHFQKSALSS
jgi:queuine tRNA-ribosyltransferase